MRNRLQWSDVQLLRSIVVFLDTPGWHHLSDDSEEEADDRSLTEVKSAVEYIVSESHWKHQMHIFRMKLRKLLNMQGSTSAQRQNLTKEYGISCM